MFTLITTLSLFGVLWGLSLIFCERPKWHVLRKGSGGKVFVFIGGFGQPVGSWETFCRALKPEDRAVVLSRRYLENNSWTVLPISWTSTIIQKWVLAVYLAQLLHNERDRGTADFTLVAHSAGGLLADYLAKKFPKEVAEVILLNSYPVGQRAALLTNKTFWKEGGLRALLTAGRSLIMFWCGLRPTGTVSNSLFASNQLSEEENRANHEALVPDGVPVFAGMALWLKGTGLLKLKRRGQAIPISVVYSHIDPIFRPEDQRAMARRLDARLFSWHERTPHCWWLNNEPEVVQYNLNVLHQVLYHENMTTGAAVMNDVEQPITLH